MATKTVAGIKFTKKAPRNPLFADEAHTGTEPLWDNDRAVCFSDEEHDHHMRQSWYYYNYYYNQKDLKKYVLVWMKEHAKRFTKLHVDAMAASDANVLSMTVCGMIKATTVGMPMRDRHIEYCVKHILAAIEPKLVELEAAAKAAAKAAKSKVAVKAVVSNQPTIQERLAEKTAEIIGEVEGLVDEVFANQPQSTKVFDLISSKGLAQAQVGKVRSVFQRQIDELAEMMEGKDAQLKEGYSHLKKADLKRVNDFYVKLMADLDAYTAVKKATKKVRKAKPQSKDKLVAKVNFLKESKELKLVSIPPVNIIGAQVLWVYHTKYKKLGRYVADDHQELGIKGTTVTGFSEFKSVAKTLRKPAEQLPALMKTGKVGLRTFLKDIKAVETKLNGRISAEILLLKVE